MLDSGLARVWSNLLGQQTEYAIEKGSGVSQSVVNRFVNRERGISLETAARLCAYLDLQLTRRSGR